MVYDVEADRAETVASWKAGQTGPEVYRLPSRVLAESPYTRRADDQERQWEATWGHYVYLDSFTGQVVRPNPALGLVDARQFLIDIVGDRALVIYSDSHPVDSLGSGRLTLFRGEERTDLGVVSMVTVLHAVFQLSPDRNHIVWSGPEGTRIADLGSGKIIERPGAYSWALRTRGWPYFRAGERVVDWLPDSSGRIEFWHDGDEAWHWEVFEPLGETPLGSGEGRAACFSPDVAYVLVLNEEAESYRGKPLPPGVPPYLLRPLPKRATPGVAVVADREGRGRGWAVEGDHVSYFSEALASETEMAVYRITPEGFTAWPIRPAKPSYATVLAVADGGRLGVWGAAGGEGDGKPPATGPRYETVIYDFAGKERLRFGGYPQAPDPESGIFSLLDGEGEDVRVTLTNALTGDRGAVLRCSAKVVRVAQQGGHFVAYAFQGAERRDALNVLAARAGDAQWNLIAEGVHTPKLAMWQSLYR